MTYLIDTNVISEIRKGSRCDPRVAAWWKKVSDGDLYLSVLVLGEIRAGIERARPNDPAKAEALERWLHEVEDAFANRTFDVDRAIASQWGRMNALRPLSVIDGLLAATAAVHRLTLVTRNAKDVAGLGAQVVNPFTTGR